MKNWLYALVVFIAKVHDKLVAYNRMLSAPFSDKEMHFIVMAVFGLLFFLIVLPLFLLMFLYANRMFSGEDIISIRFWNTFPF